MHGAGQVATASVAVVVVVLVLVDTVGDSLPPLQWLPPTRVTMDSSTWKNRDWAAQEARVEMPACNLEHLLLMEWETLRLPRKDDLEEKKKSWRIVGEGWEAQVKFLFPSDSACTTDRVVRSWQSRLSALLVLQWHTDSCLTMLTTEAVVGTDKSIGH